MAARENPRKPFSVQHGEGDICRKELGLLTAASSRQAVMTNRWNAKANITSSAPAARSLGEDRRPETSRSSDIPDIDHARPSCRTIVNQSLRFDLPGNDFIQVPEIV